MNKGGSVLLTSDEIKQPYEELSFIQVSAPAQGGHDELMETAFSIHPLFIAVAYNAIAAEGLAVRYKD